MNLNVKWNLKMMAREIQAAKKNVLLLYPGGEIFSVSWKEQRNDDQMKSFRCV